MTATMIIIKIMSINITITIIKVIFVTEKFGALLSTFRSILNLVSISVNDEKCKKNYNCGLNFLMSNFFLNLRLSLNIFFYITI